MGDLWKLQGLRHHFPLCQSLFELVQGTLCNQRLERINDTKHARILRVPFKDKQGKVVQKWMSR